jgi:flagellar motility protein MotE (MotC chaperone)
VLIAVGCLFALKTIGLMTEGGYTLGQRLGGSGTLVVTTIPGAAVAQMRSPAVPLEVPSARPQGPKLSWMQEMFNYPGDITGSVPAPKPPEKDAAKEAEKKNEPKEPPKPQDGTVVAQEQRLPSAGERALLERLQERRQELDARARELDLRDSMLKAAEKKLEVQAVGEKGDEANGAAPAPRKDKEDVDTKRFKGVVIMYETMKPKEAAKIFDRLDIRILLDLATQIKPQRMSEIMAQMSPEAAERLTVELAARGGGGDRTLNPANLPKIDGRPSGS